MKTAFAAAFVILASAVPALADGDGDNANRIRASIYETAVANQSGAIQAGAVRRIPMAVAASTVQRPRLRR